MTRELPHKQESYIRQLLNILNEIYHKKVGMVVERLPSDIGACVNIGENIIRFNQHYKLALHPLFLCHEYTHILIDKQYPSLECLYRYDYQEGIHDEEFYNKYMEVLKVLGLKARGKTFRGEQRVIQRIVTGETI